MEHLDEISVEDLQQAIDAVLGQIAVPEVSNSI